jgi:RNase E specificity factor CsrD
MILTRILTKKLTSFWLMSLVGVAFICFLTAMFSFVQLTHAFQQQKVSELEGMLQQQFAVTVAPEEKWQLNNWLPPLLHAYQAQSFVLTKGNVTLFEYKALKPQPGGVQYSSQLENGLMMEQA